MGQNDQIVEYLCTTHEPLVVHKHATAKLNSRHYSGIQLFQIIILFELIYILSNHAGN